MTDLSVLIPSRNEMFLSRTIQDILEHSHADTEIIAVLDGAWAEPPIPDHPRVTLVYYPQPIGQRAATNVAARLAKGKYVMKCDAHCAFDDGFDVKMLADMQDDWTMVPIMRNLHAFDWVCEDGHRRYQGPSGDCKECGKPTTMDVVWIPKTNPQSTSYRFDNTLHFQYWNEYKKKQIGDLVDTLSLQGSCFMMTRDRYFDLNICDEDWGSWGQQGVEVAVKSWLSGGRVVCNKKTWYAHLFRTQGGDFGFPYPMSGSQVEHARKTSREILMGDKWDKAVHPFSWLIDKFNPPDWKLSKSALYYTCNTHRQDIEQACRTQLRKATEGFELVCVSLQPTDFGDWRIHMPLERSPLTMHKQIVAGLEHIESDIVFLCESDVLYHPSHFDFVPPERDVFYYNTNIWRVRYPDGLAIWTDDLQQISGICAYRDTLLNFFRRRVKRIERDGFNKHYEPNDRYGCRTGNWQSAQPNVDIRHDGTITRSKWKAEDFCNQRYAKGFKKIDDGNVPGWGKVMELLNGR